MTPAQMVGVDGGGSAPRKVLDPSKVNTFRISAVMDRLLGHVHGTAKNDSVEFLNLCLSLSRGIDFAIANFEVPSRAQELPSLLNQMCRCKNDAHLQSAVMVLMISVKNACHRGWFSNKDSDELINLAKEMASNFCDSSNFDSKFTCSPSVTSTIMSRMQATHLDKFLYRWIEDKDSISTFFLLNWDGSNALPSYVLRISIGLVNMFYPRMRMGPKLVFFEVKPGFDAYVSGFQISKTLKPTPGQRIRLFVAQRDNITTSSCLTSPSKVNFLLNGKGVESRTTISVDTGPQIPTDVTHMLKYGSNLLQAVGEFNGNYIIALAVMSEMPNPQSSALQDYEQHALTTVDSDSEIIEGASRISLNCPISLKRIKTPVKGYSCKHIQCFDFENYMDINSRRPSWRCPHCNQHVCFNDIRIDRKMVKILKEVGTNDNEVIFASDGSWNVVTGTDDTMQKSEDKISNNAHDEPPQSESVTLSNAPVDVLDLTLIDDTVDSDANDEIQDKKLTPTYQCQTATPTTAVDPQMTNTSDANQSNDHLDDDFWSGIFLPNIGEASSDIQSNLPIDGVSATISDNIAETPVLTHPIVPSAPNQELETVHGDALVTASLPQSETFLPTTLPASVPQSETFSLTTLPFQQNQFGNSAVTNEYGRFPCLPRNVTRTPTMVQALPVQTHPDSVLQKRPRNSMNTFTQNSSSAASQASPRAQMIPNSTRMNPFYASQRSSSPLHQYMGMQRNHPFPSVRSSQPNAPAQGRNSYSALNEHGSSTPPHLIGPRMPSAMQSPANFPRPQSHVGVSRDRTSLPVGAVTGQQAGMSLSACTSGQMARPVEASRTTTSYAIPSNHSMPSTRDQGSSPEITSSQGPTTAAVDPTEQNWRPAGRMRGALTGQAYTDALNQYVIRPNQQVQATGPSLPPNVPAHLQSLMADTTAPQPPEPSPSSGASVTGPEVSSKLPDISSGTK